MSKFQFHPTKLEGAYIIQPTVFGDNRGYFMETYHQQEFQKNGVDVEFVQDNQSLSKKGVLRGLHFQYKQPQAKLVRVLQGEVYDVAVDLREGSPSYLQWEGVLLSRDNKKQFYIPEGMAHGFLVLSDRAEFTYKCSDFYAGEDEGGIRWDDPDIGIEWPLDKVEEVLLSDKDKNWGDAQDTPTGFKW